MESFLTFQLAKTITSLWRWLSHRLSKPQSPTTVLLRTQITQMIIFNQDFVSLLFLSLGNESITLYLTRAVTPLIKWDDRFTFHFIEKTKIFGAGKKTQLCYWKMSMYSDWLTTGTTQRLCKIHQRTAHTIMDKRCPTFAVVIAVMSPKGENGKHEKSIQFHVILTKMISLPNTRVQLKPASTLPRLRWKDQSTWCTPLS
mgnify:FL=1